MNRASNIYNSFGTDKELIRKIKSKDPNIIDEGYEGIYNKYSKLVFVCINNVVHNYSETEDLLADTFMSIFEHRENLLEERNLKYYIVTTARNTAINHCARKRLEVMNVDDVFLEDFESNDDMLDDMINDLKLILDNNELSIVLNHLVNGLTFEEIGKHLSVSENTIKTTYYRALKKVK